ncbi:MAG TPA: YcxB family protein [Acidobacteriaceae bacterium]
MIETVYSVTEAEFVEASQLWCPQVVKKLPGYVLAQIALGVAGACVVISFRVLPYWLCVALVISIGTWLLLGRWRSKAIRKNQYMLFAESMTEVSVRFDDDGYHDHKDGRGSSWIAWKIFTGWAETPRIFVLGINQNFVTIPKSALSGEQQDNLRTLLRQHTASK